MNKDHREDEHDVRCFFDVSALLDYVRAFERYSGIQRVVATLIENYLYINGGEGVYISFLERGLGKYKCLELKDFDPLFFSITRLACGCIRSARGIKSVSCSDR